MICRFCGNDSKGILFSGWVKPTFTDHDKLKAGEIVCNDCLFWFVESSQELADMVGKEKPQRMRNYSHFIVNGQWVPLSKGDKSAMVGILLSSPFPELAAIAESGQKHIVFRAIRNDIGGKAGWIQFEEQSLWLDPKNLKETLEIIEPALSIFSKSEIKTGNYKPHRILNEFGIIEWRELEQAISKIRGSLFFELTIFLAQAKAKETEGERNSSRFTGNNLERDRQRLQKSLPSNNMGTVREYGEGKRVHEQSRKVRQLTLFEAGCTDSRE